MSDLLGLDDINYIQNELVYKLNLNFYCIIDDSIKNFIIRLSYKNKWYTI